MALVDEVDVPHSLLSVKGDPFADGQDHLIRLTVTPRTVTAMVDDKTYVQWQGDPATLQPYDYLSNVESPLLIRTYSEFFVSDLKLEAIDAVEVSEPKN